MHKLSDMQLSRDKAFIAEQTVFPFKEIFKGERVSLRKAAGVTRIIISEAAIAYLYH